MFMIFLDDERNPEDVTWMDYSEVDDFIVVRNSAQFKDVTHRHLHKKLLISLDHDIQDFNKDTEVTGYDCLKWLVNVCYLNKIDIDNVTVKFHTQNPVGKKNMETYWNNFKKVYNIK